MRLDQENKPIGIPSGDTMRTGYATASTIERNRGEVIPSREF